jgi:uncharacterized SAM-dependent methyltransferase
MEFNDLIFKELIKRGYSLEGKTRVWNIADSKLWYLTPEQAQAYFNLENSKNYRKEVTEKEKELIKNNLKQIKSDLKEGNLNLIDLGCGDGDKALFIVNLLDLENKVRYCPIDISPSMIKLALENFKKHTKGDSVEVKWKVSDFENLDSVTEMLVDKRFQNNLFLFLDSTLENFDINEVLHDIRSAMKNDDLLLVGNRLIIKNQKEITKNYQSNYLIDNLLVKTLEQIGFKKDELKYGVRYRNSRIEMIYTILADKVIGSQHKKVSFKKGEKIIVALSYKYNQDDFKRIMMQYFDEITFFTSEDSSYSLVLCKK